jgi:hypothetical protein
MQRHLWKCRRKRPKTISRVSRAGSGADQRGSRNYRLHWIAGDRLPNLSWGILSALMRSSDAGALISAVLPMAPATAVDPHRSVLLCTAGLCVVIEVVSGQILEPMIVHAMQLAVANTWRDAIDDERLELAVACCVACVVTSAKAAPASRPTFRWRPLPAEFGS